MYTVLALIILVPVVLTIIMLCEPGNTDTDGNKIGWCMAVFMVIISPIIFYRWVYEKAGR